MNNEEIVVSENISKAKRCAFAFRIVKLYDYSAYQGVVEATEFKYQNSKTT